MIAISNSNVSSFRDLSLWQSRKLSLSNLPKALAALDKLKGDTDRLEDLHNKVQSINFSIRNFKNASLIRKIWDIINGNYFKLIILRKSMPKIAAEVDKLAKGIIIESKCKLMYSVQERFYQKYSADESAWSDIAKQVNSYIQGKITQLAVREQNVPLPRWFHATKQAFWDRLASSKTIEQRSAPMGHGAFVSSNDESLSGYGPYTFALDDSAVRQFSAAYFQGRNALKDSETFDSLWARVEHDINLSPDTVAHFVIPVGEDRNQTGIRLLTDLSLEVPVITRDVSTEINRLFDEVIKQRQLRPSWHRHELHPYSVLPANITEPF